MLYVATAGTVQESRKQSNCAIFFITRRFLHLSGVLVLGRKEDEWVERFFFSQIQIGASTKGLRVVAGNDETPRNQNRLWEVEWKPFGFIN